MTDFRSLRIPKEVDGTGISANREAKQFLQEQGLQEKDADFYSFETDDQIRDRQFRTERSRRDQISNPGFFDTLGRGFSKGVDNLQGSAYGIVGLLGDAVGSEGLKDFGLKGFARNELEASETYTPIKSFLSTDEDGAFGSGGNFLQAIPQAIGEALPSILESVGFSVAGAIVGSQAVPGVGPDDIVAVPAGGIAGLFAKNSVKKYIRDMATKEGITEAAARQLVTPALERQIYSNAVRDLSMKMGGGLAVGLTEAGSNFAELSVHNGIDAPMTSLLFGLVSGASEQMFGLVPDTMKSFMKSPMAAAVKSQSDKFGMKAGMSWAWDIMEAAAKEGGQEAFQGFLSSLNKEVNDPNFEITSKDTFMEWMEAAAAGALVGGPFRAGSRTLESARTRLANPVSSEIVPGENAIETPTLDLDKVDGFKAEDGRLSQEGQNQIFEEYLAEDLAKEEDQFNEFRRQEDIIAQEQKKEEDIQAFEDAKEARYSRKEIESGDFIDLGDGEFEVIDVLDNGNVIDSGGIEHSVGGNIVSHKKADQLAQEIQEDTGQPQEAEAPIQENTVSPIKQRAINEAEAAGFSRNLTDEETLAINEAQNNLSKGYKPFYLKRVKEDTARKKFIEQSLEAEKKYRSFKRSSDKLMNYVGYKYHEVRANQMLEKLNEFGVDAEALRADYDIDQKNLRDQREEDLAGFEQNIDPDLKQAIAELSQPATQQAPVEQETPAAPDNAYMRMPIERLKKDAELGVNLAKQALEARQDELKKKPSLKDKAKSKKKESADDEVRRLDNTGRATDGKPIMAGDVFETSSGRQTTEYPKTSKRNHSGDTRKANQWLIDNAVAEAESRNDSFNAGIFKNEDASNLPPASIDSMQEYLFGEQPEVPPPITRPLVQETDEKSKAAQETEDSTGNYFPEKQNAMLDLIEKENLPISEFHVWRPGMVPSKDDPLFNEDGSMKEGLTAKQKQEAETEELYKDYYDAQKEVLSYKVSGRTKDGTDFEFIYENRRNGKDPLEIIQSLEGDSFQELALNKIFEGKSKQIITWDPAGINKTKFNSKQNAIDSLKAMDIAEEQVNLKSREKEIKAKYRDQIKAEKKSLKKVQEEEKEEKQPEPEPEQEADAAIQPSDIDPAKLSEFFSSRINEIIGTKMDNRKLKKLVAEYTGGKVSALTQKNGYKHKDVQEALERSIVKHAKTLLTGNIDKDYKALKDLYNNQPLLNARTGGSIARQAYSTPIHYAYLANLFAMANQKQAKVYEPTAGNGALVLASNPENVFANELDPFREQTLKELGFNEVTNLDASNQIYGTDFDSVVMNPPFGSIKAVDVDGAKIKKLEHVIALNALKSLKKDGGRASIIIGGSPEGKTTLNDKVFMNQLRKNFNVEGYYNIDGKEYSRQGTSFPTVLIVVGPKTGTAPDIDTKKVWSVDEVYEQFKKENRNGLLARPENYEFSESVSRFDGTADGQDSGSTDLRGQSSNESTQQPEGGLASTDTRDTGLRSDTDGRVQQGGDQQGRDSGSDNRTTGTLQSDQANGNVSAEQQADRTDGQSGAVQSTEGDQATSPARSESKPRTDIKETTGEFQSTYNPQSHGKTVETLIPNNQRVPTKEALKALTQEVGDIDTYVQGKLGYKSKKDLYKALSAEQIDALGLGIHNAETGKSLIIGDQTGVGKGRVAAGMIRYAIKKGMKPIFVTETPGLFSDMFRDLNDISIGDKSLPVPFIVNGATKDAKIIDPNDPNKILHKKVKRQIDADVASMKKGDYSFDDDADFIMTTYSQLRKAIQYKVNYLQERSQNSFLVLDESHNAAGASYQGESTREMLSRASGAVYLSATYAKTPKNMAIYDKTILGRTGLSSDDLAEALSKGGNPLQEFVSEALVLAGEYVRREKSFDGIETNVVDVKTTDAQKQEYDQVVSFYRDLIEVDSILGPEIARIGESKVPQSMRMKASGNASSSVESGNFSSTVHNNISQLLLAMKTKETVADAVAQIKAGNKVIITLANTMESILPKSGTAIGVDFRATLDRAITNILKASYKDPDGNPAKVKIEESELSPDSRALIDRLRREVRNLSIELPASPIDAVMQGIQDAGYSIEELTGRGKKVNREGEVIPRSRPGTASVINDFNNGDLNAIIANEVIATGFSLHSSEKFKDKSKRVMILAQAHLDINKVMQMLGRVNRTGQVVKPEYRYIRTDLPAEIRPFTVFMKKMKSLNANTSANSESENSLQVEDIINKYGDVIVQDYMKERFALAESINLVSINEDGGKEIPPPKDFAHRATGRLALASIKDQNEFWEQVVPTYNEFIRELNAAGQNDIDSQFLDFKAELIDEDLIYPGDNSNPLTGAVKSGQYKVRILQKPFKRDQVIEMASKKEGVVEELKSLIEEKTPKYIKELEGQEGKEKILEQVKSRFGNVKRQLDDLEVGKYYDWYVDGENQSGVLVDVKFDKKSNDPSRPSSIRLVFAVNSGVRKITRSLSQLPGLYQAGWGQNRGAIPLNWDDAANKAFENRTIITGNILKGFDLSGKGRDKGKASIITFSDKDGNIQRGVLLPRGKEINSDGIRVMPVNQMDLRKLIDSGTEVFTAGPMTIKKDGADWKVTFPVKLNKKLVVDKDLNRIEKTGDFQKNDREAVYQGYVQLDDIIKFASLKGMGFNVARNDKNLEIVSDRSETSKNENLEKKVNPEVNEDPDTKFRTEEAVKYDDLSTGDKAEAMAIVEKMTGTRNAKFAEKLFSEKGLEVLGKYREQYIEIATNAGNVEDTARHEALHFAYDVLLTEDEARAFDTAATSLGLSHEDAIERVNEFAGNTKGLPAKLRLWGGRIIRRIKSLFGASNAIDTLNDIYDRAISGKFAERGQTGESNYAKVQKYEGGHEMFRSREALNKAGILDVGRVKDAYDYTLKTWKNYRMPNKGEKKDLLPLDKIIRTIASYAERVPALKRVFDIGNALRDNKTRIARTMLHENNGEGFSNFDSLSQWAKKNKKMWEKLQTKYLWQRDRDQYGYTVQQNDAGYFNIVDPEGIEDKKNYSTADEAWNSAFYNEYYDMIDQGWSKAEAEAVLNIRKMMRRQHRVLSGNLEQLEQVSKKFGIQNPTIGDTTLFDLFEELKKMGDLSGSYIPRLRTGRQMLWAKKKGENPRLELFDTKAARAIRATQLKNQGYTIENDISNTPSQDAFLEGGNIVAINDLVNNALQRAESGSSNLSDLGMLSSTHEYLDAAGRKRNNLIISGDEAKQYGTVFESFGAKQEGNSWVFRNKSKDRIAEIEKSLASAIHNFNGRKVLEFEAFGRSLAEQMAVMFHSKGSRARKISRDGKKGKDVYLGFEEDILKAVSMSITATAGGTAKRNMAKGMIDAMTGRDLKWDEYLKENLDPSLAKGTEAYYDAKVELWPKYQEAVRERSIDSAKQPRAFQEGLDYMKEMLRNEEASERIMGHFRALAAFKYLSGFSSGLVNLTALGTVVPGAMAHFGKVNIKNSFGLLAKASTDYTKYMMYEKFGKGKELDADKKWLFDEITKRGWDADLMNEEAIGATRNWGGRKWAWIMEKSMLVFGATERLNRASTIAGSYNGLVEAHEGKLTKEKREEYLKLAKRISDKAHGVYGKPNMPAWARGSGVGPQALRSWYMFQTFTHNYVQLIAQVARQKDFKSLAWLTLSPAVIGGASASLLTPLVAGMAKAIPGFEEPDDVEEAFYEFVGEFAGERAESLARFGVAGQVGVSLKGSLAIRTELPTSLKDLGGAPLSAVNDIYTGLDQLANGNVQKGFESISPRILSSFIKSHREYTEGITNRRDQPIFYGNERLKASLGESLWRAFGFNPVGIAEKRERQWKDTQLESKYRDDKSEIYNGIRRFMLNGGSQADWAEHLQAIEEYNARVRRTGNTNIPQITPRSVRGVITAMEKSSRREARRQKEIDGEVNIEAPDFSNFSLNSEKSEGRRRLRSRSRSRNR